MRHINLIYLLPLLLWHVHVHAQTADTLTADYSRTRYHHGDLTHYLEQHNDYTIYQGVYQGQWSDGDPLIFSVNGNSYRWNKYYIDGMRVDDRFNPGSSLYRPNLESNDLYLDYITSRLRFEADTTLRDYVRAAGNFGGLGGINSSTAAIIRLQHGTGLDSADDPEKIKNRQHTTGAGTVEATYTFGGGDGTRYRQHLYATYGRRQMPNYDRNGLIPSETHFPTDYLTVQFDGALPSIGGIADKLGYRVHYGYRGSEGSEHYMNPNEQSVLRTISGTLYGKKGGMTTGLTWSTNIQRHKDLRFERNIVDQDGESLSPWSPDGNTHELTWYVDYKRPLLPWLTLHAEGYNSFIHFSPTVESWENLVYEQQSDGASQKSPKNALYRYEWESRSFSGGLLENSIGLEVKRKLGKSVTLSASLDATLDGFVLRGKTHIMPNCQAAVSFDIHPWKWLRMSVNLGYDRVSYSIEHLRYFSNDYMNGKVYFDQGDKRLLTTTGGAYHRVSSHSMMQPSYLTFNMPIHLTFGRHEIALLQTYRKYCNVWMTGFEGGAMENGYYDTNGIYYLNAGAHDYVVGYQPHELMGTGFLTNTPYHISQLTRYTYRGKKFMASVSWQSLRTVGASALGVGPQANDIGVLSETTANPNTHIVKNGTDRQYPAVGRLDQDKAYICRIYLGYNVCKNFQFGISGKWTDGQPFSVYNTYESVLAGNRQLAVVPANTRGVNPTDGDFGFRESAIFNIDIHARGVWKVCGHDMTLSVYCYNIYDFGNVLNEYVMPQGCVGLKERGPNMCLTIPRGLLCSLKFEL